MPFALYMIFLMIVLFAQDLSPYSYAPLKLAQFAIVIYFIWRWRKLTPELSWKFHWLAIPSSVLLFVAWIVLHWLSVGVFDLRMDALEQGRFISLGAGSDRPAWADKSLGPTVFWLASIAHLPSMLIAVPMVEEMFNRSLILRACHRPRQTAIGLLQVVVDLPVIGEWLIQTKLGGWVSSHGSVFSPEFERTGLGRLSMFGVAASTLAYMSVHHPADWAGCVLCGIVWCLLLAATRRNGLGPVIWSHALTNGLLWTYVIVCQDWMFL